MFVAFFQDESGVTAIEYGLYAALISLVILGSVHSAGEHLKRVFNNVTELM